MEMTEPNRRMPKWAADLLIWCCPTVALILAFVCIQGLTPNRRTVIALIMLLLVGLIVSRLIFLLRSQRTAGAKIWRSIVWTILLSVLCFFGFFFFFILGEHHRSIKTNAQSKFEATVETILPEVLPVPMELGSPESVVLHKHVIRFIVFQTYSYTLLCRYDPAGYEAEKAALDARYDFRTEPLDTGRGNGSENVLIEPRVSIGNDEFRFLYPKDGDSQYTEFYKESFLIVTNDETREIGYILFIDLDLDYMEDLTEFVTDYCGWNYIRE